MALITMIFSAFFSGMEIAFVSSNKVRVEIDVQKSGIVSHIINIFYNHRDMFISTMLVGNNIMLVIYSMSMAELLDEPFKQFFYDNQALILIVQTIVSTGIILVTAEFLPKAVFRINPNDSLRAFSIPLFLMYLILYPISWFTSFLSSSLMRLMGVRVSNKNVGGITMGELDAYLEENIDTSEEEHKEVEREVKIFQNALDFSNTHLRDCMVPRNEIVAVNISGTKRDALSKLFTQTGLSKIVVYNNDIDNVLGYIHVSELLKPEVDWHGCIKPVIFAPESLLANKMMQRLLNEKRSMAIVVDEFGGTAGMVTLEDLVEEIFGEIEDEHDRNRIVACKISDGVYEFSGRIEIEEINEQFHLDLPESDDYQTLAGYLLNELEEIPEEGEKITLGEYTFIIIKKTAAKIELVRVTPAEEQEKD